MDKLKENLFSLLYAYSSINTILEKLERKGYVIDFKEEVDRKVNIYTELIAKSSLLEEYNNFVYKEDEW